MFRGAPKGHGGLFEESTLGKQRLGKDALTGKVTGKRQADYSLIEQPFGTGSSSYHTTH